MNLSRRALLAGASTVPAGFLGLGRFLEASESTAESFSYGPLIDDPKRILDLPSGFRYRVISRLGQRMSDGFKVPGQPDGMAAFPAGRDRVVLVRNHEIGHNMFRRGPFDDNSRLPDGFDERLCYDPGRFGAQPFVGGTTNLVYRLSTGQVESQFLSLVGTDRNCAGGPTPWNSWITCEEPGDLTSRWGRFHGYCFEVPAATEGGPFEPVPLRGMGRFRHEAVAVDPGTGIVYLTEDRSDGVLYRFVPDKPGRQVEEADGTGRFEPADLAAGGTLQALVVRERPRADTRNWATSSGSFPLRQRLAVDWIDLEDVESPGDTLRLDAAKRGAALFARAEGMWYGEPGAVGESSIYWACTNGGRKQLGQIFRYFPRPDGSGGELELYLEPNDAGILRNADNITFSAGGHLFICEDTAGRNRIHGVTPGGEFYPFARHRATPSEFAGACFSPDGSTLFVNIQFPGLTLAVTGPFA